MKLLHLLIALFLFNQGIAQDFKYGEIPVKNAKGISYQTESGVIIKKGDVLILGKPIGTDGNFSHITQNGLPVIGALSGNEVKVDHIKAFKQAAFSGKAFVAFKGYGLIPCYINYELAIETGEVINNQEPMSKAQAIEKLKEAKELLELDVITQEEYDSLKLKLSPIIKGG
jgi:hypothetical protein